MPTKDYSATLISPRSIAIEYRKLWAVGVAFVLLTGVVVLLAVNQSHNLYQDLSKSVHLRARIAAQSAASQVSADLNRPVSDSFTLDTLSGR
jgi:hypothetical protein